MEEKNERVRKVFLDELPHGGKGVKNSSINWLKSKNHKVRFIYDDIKSWVKIVEVKRENGRTILGIKYLDNDIFYIFTGHFQKCKFKELLGLINHDYLYKIDEIIKDEKRNLLILEQLYINGYRYYKYKCLNCGYIGNIAESHLNEGKNCSICSHQKVKKEINSLWATDNELVKYFVNEEESYEYPHYSEQSVEVRCPDCGTIRKISIVALYMNGFTCPKCGDGISMPNKMMFNILEQLLELDNFEREYSPTWIGRRLYDFYFKLNDKEYIIEMDGGLGHGNQVHNNSKVTSAETSEIDDYKDKMAEEHGIEVIRIDCNPSNFNYIKQNTITNNKLNLLFTLDNIDWELVSEFIITNKMKEACDLWNNGYNTKEISSMFKFSPETVRRYLHNGTKLNLCTYNSIQSQFDSHAKKVKCIEYNLIFNSITECANKLSNMLNLKFSIGCISEVCKGNRKTHKKLHFEFV